MNPAKEFHTLADVYLAVREHPEQKITKAMPNHPSVNTTDSALINISNEIEQKKIDILKEYTIVQLLNKAEE